MDSYISLVQTHTGRDRILRAAGYTCTLLSHSNPSLAQLSKLITSCRSCLRMFDDVVIFRNNCKLASGETDVPSRLLTILANATMQIYLPLDHLSLLSDYKVIPSSFNFKTPSQTFNAIILFTNLLKNMRKLRLLYLERDLLLRRLEVSMLEGRNMDNKNNNNEEESNEQLDRKSLSRCKQQCIKESLLLIKNILDFIVIVSVLPWKRFLWASTANPTRNAKFGLISSIASIIHLLMPK